MNKIPRQLIWLMAILLMLVWLSPMMAQAENRAVPNSPVTLEVGISGFNQVKNGLTEYIQQIYFFATGIVGGLAVVMIIIGAVQYSTSAGNRAALGSAKETITSAIIGLVIVLMAYLILGTFSGSFVNLANPRLDPITVNNSNSSNPTHIQCVEATGQTPTCQEVSGAGSDSRCTGKASGDFCGQAGTDCRTFTTQATCPDTSAAHCEWCDVPTRCTGGGCFAKPHTSECQSTNQTCCQSPDLCRPSSDCKGKTSTDPACNRDGEDFSRSANCTPCGGWHVAKKYAGQQNEQAFVCCNQAQPR